jgi:hypothetical protein
MDINALRVFDSIHSLSITEEEFTDLEIEQKHTERTGLYIRCVRFDYSIGVSHDENHKIIIREIKKKFPVPSRVLFKTLITFDELPEEIYTLHAIAQYRALDIDMKFRADNLEELKDRICEILNSIKQAMHTILRISLSSRLKFHQYLILHEGMHIGRTL